MNKLNYFLIIIAVLFLSSNNYGQSFTLNEMQGKEYVENITSSLIDNEIIINYDLINPSAKGYVDQYKRVKGCKFIVELYYSFDGRNFNKVDNADGDIGPDILVGKNKVIKWNVLDSALGLIGNVIFYISPKPILPKLSFSLTYTTWITIGNDYGPDENFSNNSFEVKLYKPLKNGNGSIVFPINFSSFTDETGESSEHGIAFAIGMGWQSNKRIFSIYSSVGPTIINRTVDNEEYNETNFSAFFGLDFKLLDFKKLTFLLPLKVALHPSSDLSIIQTGICLQF
jgi:hypothetical protein